MVRYTRLEHRVVAWMQAHGLKALRYSIAIVFLWFGFLKVIGKSPAAELVMATMPWPDPALAVVLLGLWEVAIGVCFFFRPLLRGGIVLLAPQMVGTFLPLLTLPEATWQSLFVPTMAGQYIIKNLLIISGALVVGAHLYDRKERA